MSELLKEEQGQAGRTEQKMKPPRPPRWEGVIGFPRPWGFEPRPYPDWEKIPAVGGLEICWAKPWSFGLYRPKIRLAPCRGL